MDEVKEMIGGATSGGSAGILTGFGSQEEITLQDLFSSARVWAGQGGSVAKGSARLIT